TRLQELARIEGKDSVHRRLAEVDPESAERLHPNDLLRVIRALEVYQLTGRKFSQSQISTDYQQVNPYRLHYFGLGGPREWLYDRINRRVDLMIEQGLIQEVRNLLAQGCHPRSNSLKAIGYRHAVQYLRGLLSFAEMSRLLKRDTRHFAKRQLTWFRRDPRIVWYDAVDIQLEEIVADMVERICSGGQDGVK
ncbi:MAG TPA: tRNA (adenosine(37)-N6)-dimethylallyltransferase MiaA, partial [Verrucomicrobiae bacterium]|nr:tRNA (adenosine(37)-N6)-dimethylallyltransferase MiaA [Verrucomicrobiae bacterium]